MDNTIENTAAAEPEEEGLDIMAMVRSLWDGRKTIIICTAICLVLGVLAALTMKRSYTVKTVMVPQLGQQKNSLSSLASLAGFDMGATTSNGELSPLVYPQIANSTTFQLQLMHTPLHYSKCDTMISMFDYAQAGYEKPTVIDVVKRYTIGLPGVIMGLFKKPPEEIVLPSGSAEDSGPKPIVVSVKEQAMLDGFGNVVMLDVDKKEGYITLTVNGLEPIQTAELALKAQQLLQDEVTRFRVEKSQGELEYIQARYDEIKLENERNQGYLAVVTDRTQNVATQRATVEKSRVQSKYNVSNAIFLEMAKQLEQAKMQVKKDTPVFTVIQPVTIPMKPSNSRAKKVVIWTFLGIVLGCGIVIVKGYWPTLMAKFKQPKPETTAKTGTEPATTEKDANPTPKKE